MIDCIFLEYSNAHEENDRNAFEREQSANRYVDSKIQQGVDIIYIFSGYTVIHYSRRLDVDEVCVAMKTSSK